LLQRVARDVAQRARGRAGAREAPADAATPRAPGGPTADELARRLDATRERLRREIPPGDREDA
jgi:hypothetical protein